LRSSKKIVFFFPSFANSEATAPLGILAVELWLNTQMKKIVKIKPVVDAKRLAHRPAEAVC
jgi:hypothetical protein